MNLGSRITSFPKRGLFMAIGLTNLARLMLHLYFREPIEVPLIWLGVGFEYMQHGPGQSFIQFQHFPLILGPTIQVQNYLFQSLQNSPNKPKFHNLFIISSISKLILPSGCLRAATNLSIIFTLITTCSCVVRFTGMLPFTKLVIV